MKKEEHKTDYKIFKALLGTYFKLYYHPQFINKEVIPAEGPIILCGNHVHLFDQCLPIMSTKRMLHYMAKKEYFDGKHAWFFKAAGCISVDRANHGGTSKEIALEVLENGFGLGIYPEGTRNSLVCKDEKFKEIYAYIKDEISEDDYKNLLKDNLVLVSQTDLLLSLKDAKKITLDEFKKSLLDVDNYLLNLVSKKVITKEEYRNSLLLPIKFGTVSLAQKTNATIVPYAITGKYKKHGNLTVEFGTPFKVNTNDDLEKANTKLFNSIRDLKIKGLNRIDHKNR
jgi:1-acyl-sn-glycerol-3-phosphate acyltransferase